jgi:circadian clock protein KaiC
MTKENNVAATGIEGLDYILLGGFPRNHVYLLQGDPGVGKTTLGLQFLLEGARHGEKGLYITLSETRSELEAVARSHHWDLTGVEVYEHLIGEQSLTEDDTTVFYPAEVELGQTVKALLESVERVQPSRVVLDSLSEIRLLAQSTLRYRKQILALKQFFAARNMTVLMLDDRTAEFNDLQLQSVPHGVVELERVTPMYGSARRRLQLVKVRGLNFRDGYHDFNIRTGGIIVYPRLVAADEHHGYEQMETVGSDVPALDAMLGGGLDRGTSTLIMGPAGCGKSALSTQYVIGAAERGEKAAMFIFEESAASLYNRSHSLGMPLRKHVDAGLISVRQVDPAQLQPGEFVHLVRESVESGVRVLVIDSLNGYLNAVPEEKFLLLHLHELLSYLGQNGIATILVFAQHGLVGTNMHAPVDVSYLADCVVLLRYFESKGRIRKAVSVVKKRGGIHDTAIRDFTMSSKGLAIGPALDDFRGVLTGVPTFDTIVREIRDEP